MIELDNDKEKEFVKEKIIRELTENVNLSMVNLNISIDKYIINKTKELKESTKREYIIILNKLKELKGYVDSYFKIDVIDYNRYKKSIISFRTIKNKLESAYKGV